MRVARVSCSVVLVLLVACCDAPIVPLHERSAFTGGVRIALATNGAEQRLEGQLAFDLASRHCQLTLRRDGRVDTFLAEGERVQGFRDGVPCEMTAEDRDAFARVLALLRAPPPATRLEPWGDGYRVSDGVRSATVELVETASFHGGDDERR